jgi:hypothetical protein
VGAEPGIVPDSAKTLQPCAVAGELACWSKSVMNRSRDILDIIS